MVQCAILSPQCAHGSGLRPILPDPLYRWLRSLGILTSESMTSGLLVIRLPPR